MPNARDVQRGSSKNSIWELIYLSDLNSFQKYFKTCSKINEFAIQEIKFLVFVVTLTISFSVYPILYHVPFLNVAWRQNLVTLEMIKLQFGVGLIISNLCLPLSDILDLWPKSASTVLLLTPEKPDRPEIREMLRSLSSCWLFLEELCRDLSWRCCRNHNEFCT